MSVEKQLTFIDLVDADTRDSILNFDHKLKLLNEEINTKIESLTNLEDPSVMQNKLMMMNLQKEVTMALDTIDKLINTSFSKEENPEALAELNEENLAIVRDLFQEKLELLTDLNI